MIIFVMIHVWKVNMEKTGFVKFALLGAQLVHLQLIALVVKQGLL